MNFLRTSVFSVALALAGSGAHASTFDISLDLSDDLTASQKAAFIDAERFWESRIAGYQPNVDIPQLPIAVNVEAIDGRGGFLSLVGLTTLDMQGGFTLPTAGAIRIDGSDLPSLDLAGALPVFAVYQMARVMGFGAVWDLNGVYVNGSGEYTGAAGLAAYQAEIDPLATFVPVELDGGVGAADRFWDEEWGEAAGILMTRTLRLQSAVSETTVNSFVDIGYALILTPVPVPPTFALMLGMIAALGLGAKQRRALRKPSSG